MNQQTIHEVSDSHNDDQNASNGFGGRKLGQELQNRLDALSVRVFARPVVKDVSHLAENYSFSLEWCEKNTLRL